LSGEKKGKIVNSLTHSKNTTVLLVHIALTFACFALSGQALTFGQTSVSVVTPNATETFAIVTDGPHPDFHLNWDVYLPPTPGRYPAVLVIFGGEFKDGDRSEVGGIAASIASYGFVALAIDYRVDQPNTRTGQQFPVYAPPAVPNQPGDVKLAVTAARTGVIPSGNSIIKNWITGKVGAVGGSSGASHALWCAATGTLSADKLDAAVLFSGAYKFDDPASLTWPGDRRCMYGGGLSFCPDVYLYCHLNPNSDCSATPAPELQAGSPIYQVGADVSPLFWVSDAGDLITPYQFSDLANWLKSFDADPPVFESVWLTARRDECNHSFDNWQAEQGDVVTWLHARLDASQ
jgi:dienelactone hydrolase